jgi:hypothetical protein
VSAAEEVESNQGAAGGFVWRQLDATFAAKSSTSEGLSAGSCRQRIGAEPAGDTVTGSVALDHARQTAKRMQGGFMGMVIALTPSATMLSYCNMYSTSLKILRGS